MLLKEKWAQTQHHGFFKKKFYSVFFVPVFFFFFSNNLTFSFLIKNKITFIFLQHINIKITTKKTLYFDKYYLKNLKNKKFQTKTELVCICLDFLKPKTRINEKIGNKMRLAEPKTQLFKKSCVLNSGKTEVQNALHLWTSEVHK